MSSTLTITISGNPIQFIQNSLKISNKINTRTTCDFTILDTTGTAIYSKGQPVVVSDSVLGVLFSGYVNKPIATNLYPNPHRLLQISCMDQVWLADKRVSDSIYNTQQAGVIVVDQAQNILAPEGVTGAYTQDYNHYESDWTAGSPTLTNVVATTNNGDGNAGDGDLELALAGSPLAYTDHFNAGTFTNVQVVNGSLELASTQGIQLVGTAVQGNANPYVYYKIWGGSSSIQSGDKLQYDVWVSSTSPAQEAGVDLACSDGTSLRDFTPGIVDQNGIGAHPSNDLSGFATNQWYTRTFDLTPMAGKTIVLASVALEGNTNGTYTAYIRKVKQLRGGNLQTAFFVNNLQTSQIIGIQAYINTSLTQCTVYEMSGTRTAPAINLNTLGIPQTSLIDWVAPALSSSLAPGVVSKNSTLPTVTVQTSIDGGATYQPCTNYGAIPNLLAGMSVGGKNLLLQQVFTMAGSDPTITPTLTGLTLSIQPSYNATKTDVIQTEDTNSQWSAGTLTHLVASGGAISLNEISQNWNNGPLSGQTVFGSNGPYQELQAGSIYVACNAGVTSDVRSRLDFAGQWQNFICEIDLNIGTTIPNTHIGMVYRTTGWSNTENTFAWKVWYNPGSSQLNLGYGTDGGSDSYTSVAQVSITLSSGTQHRLKMVVNGTSHQMYIDGVLIINVTDSHYNQSGYLGLAFYNNATDGKAHGGGWDNFGITQSLTGSWQNVAQSLSAAGHVGNTVIQWQQVPDPTGTTSLVVQTSIDGGSTWQACTNGGTIPNLTYGMALSGVNLQIQALFTSPSANLTPILQGLTAWIVGQFNATGVWQNTPLGNDTFVRANSSGFGTSWDGQSYTQVGTGTTAIVSDEGQISATTGDVEMVLGSNTAGDEDGSVRFAVSTTAMQAGMELRRVDANNWYRLYASTSSIAIIQNSAGVPITLATATLALSINTYYRMRFRVTGGGPVNLYGRVWLDGTPEPTTWEVTFSG